MYIKGPKQEYLSDDDDIKSYSNVASSKRKRESKRASSARKSARQLELEDEELTIRSAFRQPSKPRAQSTSWSRNPDMEVCNFTRTTATFNTSGPFAGQVTTQNSTIREVIYFPKTGLAEKDGDVGFIGEGSTKCGIYVSTNHFPSWLVTLDA